MAEELYKHTLETLLRENSDDMQYFHNEICSEETKVHSSEFLSVAKFFHLFLQLDFNTAQFRETI